MAIRKSCLQAIGGFDPQFRVAGDDVDVCWRLQRKGWTLGFNPAAVVWHHPRNSVRGFWKQQAGYGKSEALLQRKWPDKYNLAGHIRWVGRLYDRTSLPALGVDKRIFYGTWGAALFQSIYAPAPSGIWSLPLMPEWYLVIVALAALSALGLTWPPLLLALPLLVLAVGALLTQVLMKVGQARFSARPRSRSSRVKMFAMTALLHLLQPLARLSGRLRHGLTIWRRSGPPFIALPRSSTSHFWSQVWRSHEARLENIERDLRDEGAVVIRGSDYDRWDLEVRTGTVGAVRMMIGIEEHGGGAQLVRFRYWPTVSGAPMLVALSLGLLSIGAGVDRAWIAYVALAGAGLVLVFHTLLDCATASAALIHILRSAERTNAKENQAARESALAANSATPGDSVRDPLPEVILPEQDPLKSHRPPNGHNAPAEFPQLVTKGDARATDRRKAPNSIRGDLF